VKASLGGSVLELIYVGTNDIATRKIARLRNPEYRRRYLLAYQEDLKKYGHELTLQEANKRLLFRTKVLELWKSGHSEEPNGKQSQAEVALRKIASQLPQRPFSKETLLSLEPCLVTPEDVDGEISLEDAFELGRIAQRLYGEKLPTIRLWIHFKEYVVGGVPDGITDSYVYEFKATTQTGRRIAQVSKEAAKQARLYAYIFKRPTIKVQIARFELQGREFPLRVDELPTPEIVSISDSTSDDQALTILRDFDTDFREGKQSY